MLCGSWNHSVYSYSASLPPCCSWLKNENITRTVSQIRGLCQDRYCGFWRAGYSILYLRRTRRMPTRFRIPLLGTEIYAEARPRNALSGAWMEKDDTGSTEVNFGSLRVILSPRRSYTTRA